MIPDDDVTREPRHEGEPVERDRGALIEGDKHADVVDDERPDIDLGQNSDPELWSAQRALIEEDERQGLNLEGFSDAEAARILEAMGDDAADPLPDSPGGISATGSWNAPDNGGFPDRD